MTLQLNDWRQRGAVSRKDAAAILGCSPAKVAQLCREGKLHGCQAGRRALVAVYSIRRYLGEPVEYAPISAPAAPSATRSVRVQKVIAEAERRLGS